MDKKRILIVDDERQFTFPTKLMLEQTGNYVAEEVNESHHALAAARSFRPDLILLDVVMPGMDGGDLAARLKEDSLLKQVPVVFLTALMDRDESQPGAGMRGGYRFLSKLLSKEELLEAIEQALAG